MMKAKTYLRGLVVPLCMLGLLLSPMAASADEGDKKKSQQASGSSGSTQEGNVKCSSDQSSFTINNNPGNGTFSDGTVSITITNSDGDSFNWSATRSLDSVLVKGGDFTQVNPGGTSGFATSAFNQNSGQNYGISHVTFCYTIRASSPSPTPTPTPTTTPPARCPTNPNLPLNHPDCGSTPPPPPVCPTNPNLPLNHPDCGAPPAVCPTNPNLPLNHPDCDEVLGGTIERPVKVCPSGPFKGMPMTNPRDCQGPGDRVLPNVITNQAQPEVEGEVEAAGAVLPFTGGGAASVLPLLITGLTLMGAGTAALRTRRKR